MHYEIKVMVRAERTEGKFASRDEIAEQIMDALESADPGSLEGENGGQYEVTEWLIEDISE